MAQMTLEQRVEQEIRTVHATSLRMDAWKNAAKAAIALVHKYSTVTEAIENLEKGDRDA